MLTRNRIIVVLISLAIVSTVGRGQDDEKEIFSQLRHTHRINAHGDEFMSMDMSPDKKRLAIGTEKGDILIWNLAAGKLENQFKEGRPIHQIAFTDDGTGVIIAGGNHTGVHNCLFGKVNISTGQFEEWPGAGNESLMYLSIDYDNSLVATANAKGFITVWDTKKGKKKAEWDSKQTILSLALAGTSLFVSRTDIDLSKESDEDETITSEVVVYTADSAATAPKVFLPGGLGALW